MADTRTLPLDSQLCFSIYSTSIAIHRAYKPMLDELGVTYTQYLVLSALWEVDGLTITAIADRLVLEPSTITPAVKRLETGAFTLDALTGRVDIRNPALTELGTLGNPRLLYGLPIEVEGKLRGALLLADPESRGSSTRHARDSAVRARAPAMP